MKNIRNGYVSLGDTRMQYAAFGHGRKKLIILPGLSDGLATVEGKALFLAWPYRRWFSSYTVYMFSRKDRLPEDYSIREMAKDQAEAMRLLDMTQKAQSTQDELKGAEGPGLEPEKFSVLGVSQGGMIAQYLAIDYPELVEKLVIAVSTAKPGEMTRECVKGWIGMAVRGDHKQLMIDTAEKSYSAAFLKKYRRLYPLLGQIGKPESYSRFLTNANAILDFDASEDLSRITCPTLIIAGEEDKIVGVQASYEMNEKIAGSRLHVYPGLGHAAYEEARDFNERVFGFLD
ncbi:MAG: alpha/beta hydrolase [Lachnospiraceae bacterium]|nr:alpha/beta hydrolase [Lachnospiraceae bacterium]